MRVLPAAAADASGYLSFRAGFCLLSADCFRARLQRGSLLFSYLLLSYLSRLNRSYKTSYKTSNKMSCRSRRFAHRFLYPCLPTSLPPGSTYFLSLLFMGASGVYCLKTAFKNVLTIGVSPAADAYPFCGREMLTDKMIYNA